MNLRKKKPNPRYKREKWSSPPEHGRRGRRRQMMLRRGGKSGRDGEGVAARDGLWRCGGEARRGGEERRGGGARVRESGGIRKEWEKVIGRVHMRWSHKSETLEDRKVRSRKTVLNIVQNDFVVWNSAILLDRMVRSTNFGQTVLNNHVVQSSITLFSPV